MTEVPRVEQCEVHTELDSYCSQCSHHMLYLIDKLKLDLKTAWFEKEVLFDQVQELERQVDGFKVTVFYLNEELKKRIVMLMLPMLLLMIMLLLKIFEN